MTLFDDVLKQSKAEPGGEWSVPEAVAAVLMSAMVSDGQIAPEEAKWTNYELPSLRVFRGLQPDALRAMTRTIFEQAQRRGADALLASAAPAVPDELRAFTFANVVDMVLADEDVSEVERAFVDNVQKALEINPDIARTIVEVMVIKHGLVG